MDETLCRYEHIYDCIHKFVFMDNSNDAIDAYIEIWQDKIVKYWRHTPDFDGTTRTLFDFRRSGMPSVNYMYDRASRILPLYPDLPRGRMAYVLHPQGNFTAKLKSLDEHTAQHKLTVRRFFNADEMDSAIAWLLGDE